MRGNGDASDAAPDSETSPVSLNRKRISGKNYLQLSLSNGFFILSLLFRVLGQ
jgi:hypothetical protein